MPETRVKVYRTPDEHARDEADAYAHGWAAVRREHLPDGTMRVLYENAARSEWGAPWAGQATAHLRDNRLGIALTLIGGVMAAIGTALPWVNASSGIFSVSRTGLEMSPDATIIAALGGALALLALLAYISREGPWWALVLGAAVLVLALGGSALNEVQGRVDDAEVVASVGIGLWTVIAGGLVAGVGGIALRRP